jgi:hypothetical protein
VGAYLAWKHSIADKIVFSKIRERLIGGSQVIVHTSNMENYVNSKNCLLIQADQLASGGSALSLPVIMLQIFLTDRNLSIYYYN